MSTSEKNFWVFWPLGLVLLVAMIALNATIARDNPALSISAHQVAGTAAAVNSLQEAWQAAGLLTLVHVSMLIDLLFIGIYSWGAWNGGRLMSRERRPVLRTIGVLVTIAAVVFCLADYTETIPQYIQVFRMEGSDMLAGVAASVQAVKMSAFLVTLIGLVVSLLIRRFR